MATHFLLPLATTLLLLLALSPTLTTGDVDTDPVLDLDGNPLEVGSRYYILPAGAGFRGGLTLSAKPGQLCPLYVVESPREVDLGKAVKFTPRDSTQTQISLSSEVIIDSGFSAYCRDVGIWRLRITPTSRRYEVVAAGAFETPLTLFRIMRVGSSSKLPVYKIVYCDPNPHFGLCQDLGIFDDNNSGLKLLSLMTNSDDALLVVFHKKTETNLVYRATN